MHKGQVIHNPNRCCKNTFYFLKNHRYVSFFIWKPPPSSRCVFVSEVIRSPKAGWPLLCRHQEPRVDLSSFSISPSCASQDGFKRLVGNVVHLLLGHHHPPRALLQVEVADPLLDQAGQLLSDFARHVIRLLASCPRNCQRATDGVRGDPAYVECYALQIRATPASPSLVALPPSTTPNPTPRQLPFLVLNPRRNRTHPPTVAELVCLRRNTCFTTTTPNIYHTCHLHLLYQH